MENFLLLESELAKWIGTNPENVVVCSSGTAALHLAFEALQLPQGSEVIMSDFNMVACPRAVMLAGLTPVFTDCTNYDLLFSLEWFLPARCRQSKAVLATHIYGRRCDMDMIHYGAEPRGLLVVEDMAEAHGVQPHPQTDAACYSHYKNKIIAGEEGGSVYFKDAKHAKLARCLRSLGFTDAHDFMHVPRGHNYRLANCLAEPILESLRIYRVCGVGNRREVEAAYDKVCPDAWKMPYRNAPWVYDLRISGMTYERQSAIVKELNGNGIDARHAFKPMSMQPEFKSMRRVGGDNTERASREVIYLPLSPYSKCIGDVNRAFDIICRQVG